MMENEVHSVEDYQFTAHDRLLLDINIWFYINGLNRPKSKKVEIYSQAFRRILEAGSRIYIDVLITSEFINSLSRLEWRQHQHTEGKIPYKQFRNSDRFQVIAEDIAIHIERVLGQCRIIESGFSTMNVTGVLDDFRERMPDFNDQMLEGLCKQNDLALVTDDGDFTMRGLRVLTANRRLLNVG